MVVYSGVLAVFCRYVTKSKYVCKCFDYQLNNRLNFVVFLKVVLGLVLTGRSTHLSYTIYIKPVKTCENMRFKGKLSYNISSVFFFLLRIIDSIG